MQQIKTTENALMVLIGEKHDSICRAAWEGTDVCITDTTAYAIETLANRPDVKAAEYALKAQMEQALVAFNQALLAAGGELSDALSACRLSSERLVLRQQEVAAAERAYEVSKDVMQNSSATYLEVLTAQQTLIQSQLALATDWLDHIQGKINLFKALGGDI